MSINKLFFVLAAVVFALATLGVAVGGFPEIPLGLFFIALGLAV